MNIGSEEQPRWRGLWAGLRTLGRAMAGHAYEPRRSPGGRDITREDALALERVASGSIRTFRFPPALEQEFQAFTRVSARWPRFWLVTLTFASFASAPLWVPLFLGEPQQTFDAIRFVELDLMSPLFGLACILQLRWYHTQFAEWVLFAAFLGEVVCIELIKHVNELVGYYIEPSLTALVPMAVIVLTRLPIARCIAFVAIYFFIITVTYQLWPHRQNVRTPTGWLMEGILLSTVLLSAISAKLTVRSQWALNVRLELMAYRDGLTGLPNRRALEDHYDSIVNVPAEQWQKKLLFVLIDLDHFKKINDIYGHQYGDGVLVEISTALSQFPNSPLDIAARMGGDEFAMILHDGEGDGGRARLAELVSTVRNLNIEHKGNDTGVATWSVGAAVIVPGAPLHQAYVAADECLYTVKSCGRNHFALYDPFQADDLLRGNASK